MQIIISHVNTDFDALASMLAAKKLYPNAKLVVSDKQNAAVKQFLAIYRDSIDLIQDHTIDWSNVTELILVDVASLERTGNYAKELNTNTVKVTVYDHHPPQEDDVKSQSGTIEFVGATVTILIEEIRKRSLPISSFEATVFGLGIYTDTGSFTYSNTTSRDLQAASFLMENGMNLEIIQRFSDQMLFQQQQEIFNHLLLQSTEFELDGLSIIVSSYQQKKFQGGLSTLTRKLLETTGADAVLTIVEMQKRVYIVGRASSDRINFLPLMNEFGGGGHEKAASATLKKVNLEQVVAQVTSTIKQIIKPAITARIIMASPVKSIPPEMTIEEAANLMYRYGHTGFPIVNEEELIGIISRRDLDKATHHGLGHAPVKAYMSSKVVSIDPDTSLEEIQTIMIKHDIGRLPVVDQGKLVGILSRTNVIEILHNQALKEDLQKSALNELQNNLRAQMKNQLSGEVFHLLKDIGTTGTNAQTSVYLIGGIVRDIMLGRENDDIDIVVEGDGIHFSKLLVEDYGGEVKTHEDFGTATWTHPTGLKIDITSSRLEYYDHPAALPDVEHSTLKEDLYRRDFTINAMAICLNQMKFGQLVDPFQGKTHLEEKTIKILHNLSFIEDPTRILRAVRFETRFQFLMDDHTKELALISIDKMKALSATRIIHELEKLFNEEHPSEGINRLFDLQFWQQFGIQETQTIPSVTHAKRLEQFYMNNRLKTLLNKKPSWFMYLLIPFYYEDAFETAKPFALTKKDRKFIKEIFDLKSHVNWQEDTEDIGNLHRLLKPYSVEAIIFYIVDEELSCQQSVMNYLEKRSYLPTYLTGEDLKNYGLKPGPLFSNVLLDLEIAILNEKVNNEAEAFTWLIEKFK
ncbi:CBS domain-containing protein [Alkalihalobacterium elongatum]|uniref:CBS domain-containing protein n=1 Tax=Alkalihalobacterium elongatum TaxID=2675466 RepID=UPI001C1F2C83|nr:CBS domain-containing protein [Alkalihalobacterium elongatum]